MTALADNPAVSNPMKVLTRVERDALLSLDFYARHKRIGPYWHIGPKRFSTITIASLKQRELVRDGQNRPLVITQAGQLVLVKLKGPGA